MTGFRFCCKACGARRDFAQGTTFESCTCGASVGDWKTIGVIYNGKPTEYAACSDDYLRSVGHSDADIAFYRAHAGAP